MVFQIKGLIPLKTVCVQHKNVARLAFCVLLKGKKKYLEYAVFGCSCVSSHEIRLCLSSGKNIIPPIKETLPFLFYQGFCRKWILHVEYAEFYAVMLQIQCFVSTTPKIIPFVMFFLE